MASPRTSPGTLRERGFLVFGLGAALVLVLAAFVGGGDPESAGRAELVSTAARVAEAVKVEWREGACIAAIAEESGSPRIEWSAGKLPFIEGRELARAAGSGHEVFDALFAQSERVELVQNDASGALELSTEALAKTQDPARRAEARLRALQLALKAARPEVARAQYDLACRELDGSERKGAISYRLLLAIAFAPLLEETDRNGLRQLIRSGSIAWTLPPPASTTQEDPSVATLVGLLESACPGGLPADFVCIRTAQAVRAEFGELPEDTTDAVHLRRAQSRFLCWAFDPSGHGRGHVLDTQWVREGLRRATTAFVPAGFAIDIDPQTSNATAVREHDTLDGDFGFTVKHEDPEGWIRRSAVKQRFLRGALLVLALLSAAAGVATFRALRRERLLATLKTDFVANVSHELRTPLSAVLGALETISDDRSDEETVRRFLDIAQRNAARLQAIVSDLLELSSIESQSSRMAVEPLGIGAPLRSAAAALAGAAESKGVELLVEPVPADLPAVAGNHERLERVFTNLIENAIKYTPRGGHVRARARRAGRTLEIEVSDDGVGIPAVHLPRIFERFYRVDRSRSREMGGTGLGLAIVKHIVRAHGGSVEVESQEGHGTLFRVSLPALDGPLPASSAA